MSDKTRLENNNLELMNIYNAVENLPNAGGGGGDVKLYDTIANMNLDHSVSEGQLAIVYSNVSANITADTEFQVGTFPETVVLPEAITDYVEVGFQALDTSIMFDCWGELEPSRYSLDVHGDGTNIRIQYTSSDGLTYTRTQFRKNNEEISGNEMDFGTIIKFGSRWGDARWDDRIGLFTQAGAVEFDGLYQYGDNVYSLAKTQFNTGSDAVYKSIFYGKNGIEEGTLQNVENLSKEQILKKAEIYSSISMLNLTEDITNSIHMFMGHNELLTVPNMNTDNITNMYGMFSSCYNLTSVPNFNTSNVIDMQYMFSDCYNLTTVPNFDTSNVKSMYKMFAGCNNLTSIPNFNLSNVTNTANMFYYCNNLTSVPNFDTSNVTAMYNMFFQCTNLINVPNFNTSKTKSTTAMFYSCYNLVNVPDFNTSSVTDMEQMFWNCRNIINGPNIEMSNVIVMRSVFGNCYNLVNVPRFNTNSALYMDGMFRGCNNLSSDSYANIANSLPLAANLYNQYVSSIGLNIENFTLEQKQILGNKGYYDALQYVTNTSNVSTSWNILYS